ncbi:MAG: DUF4352 domain-containing protein [Anaerolineae bacterium]|nr:DUF4352 domain-containing protein [Anaerolineae bacterium]
MPQYRRHAKKNRLLALIALAGVLLVGMTACDTLDATRQPVSCKATPIRVVPPLADASPQPDVSCSHPAPPGTTVIVDDLALMVNVVVRPANDVVSVGSASNLTPAEGNVFVILSLSIACQKSSDAQCTIDPFSNFALLTNGGAVHGAVADVTGVPGMLAWRTIPGGDRAYGAMVFEIGANDTQLVLKYQGLTGNTACLTVPGWVTAAMAWPTVQAPAATPSLMPTPSPSPTATPTPSPTARPTATPQTSPLTAPTVSSPLSTPQVTPSPTPSPAATLTPTVTPTATLTVTATPTATETVTPTITPTPIDTPSSALPASGRLVARWPAALWGSGVLLIALGRLTKHLCRARSAS